MIDRIRESNTKKRWMAGAVLAMLAFFSAEKAQAKPLSASGMFVLKKAIRLHVGALAHTLGSHTGGMCIDYVADYYRPHKSGTWKWNGIRINVYEKLNKKTGECENKIMGELENSNVVLPFTGYESVMDTSEEIMMKLCELTGGTRFVMVGQLVAEKYDSPDPNDKVELNIGDGKSIKFDTYLIRSEKEFPTNGDRDAVTSGEIVTCYKKVQTRKGLRHKATFDVKMPAPPIVIKQLRIGRNKPPVPKPRPTEITKSK